MKAGPRISLVLVLLGGAASPVIPAPYQSQAAVDRAAQCASVSPSTTGSIPVEAEGTATGGGEFLALLDPRSGTITNVAVKIVLAMTGTGALRITVVGPEGQVIVPSRLESHSGGSSWNHPGDEWGSMWV